MRFNGFQSLEEIDIDNFVISFDRDKRKLIIGYRNEKETIWIHSMSFEDSELQDLENQIVVLGEILWDVNTKLYG